MSAPLRYVGPRSTTRRTVETYDDTFAMSGSHVLGTVRSTRPPLPIASGTHQAFPGVTMRADKSLFMVWRSGATHTSVDGIIKSAYSYDYGRTWSTPVTALTLASTDLRDPSVSASTDGTKLWLTYFKATASSIAAGVFFRVSTDQGGTWSAETRVDANTSGFGAVSAPVVELGSTLFLPFYGKDTTGLAQDSVYVATSSNGGTSWTPSKLINGVTDGRDYQEPVAVARGATVNMFFRWGNAASIGLITSTNSASSWGTKAAVFAGIGRSNPIWFTSGMIAVSYRDLNTKALTIKYSSDSGTTWANVPYVVSWAPVGGMMTYASMVETAPNQAFMGYSEENSGGSISSLYATYIGINGGSTPFGSMPTDYDPAADDYDNTAWQTKFEQVDGSTPDTSKWTAAAGTWSITSNYVTNATSATVGYLTNDSGLVDVELEAELYMVNFTGIALIARYVDTSNYLSLTCEGPTGTPTYAANLRLYYVTGGVGTATTVTGACAVNGWHKFKLVVQGSTVSGSINEHSLQSFSIPSTANAGLMTSSKHGLRFNNNNSGSNSHRCRRFTLRSVA
jgi:BNR repeat-like domain